MQVLANLVAVLTVAAPLTTLRAQPSTPARSIGVHDSAAASLSPGARVRITQREKPQRTARLNGFGRDSLQVSWHRGADESIALSDVTKVELYLGHPHRLARAAFGAVGGMVVGGTIGKVMMDREQRDLDARKEAAYAKLASECKDIEVPALCLLGAVGIEIGSIQTPEKLVYGLGLGALLGAGVGMIGTDRWRPVVLNEPPHVGVGVPASARIGIGLAARF